MCTFFRSLAIFLLFCAVPAQAAPKHFYTDWKWWVGTAINGTMVALDMHSTTVMLSRGGTESNMILGPHPSNGEVAGLGVGAFAYWTVIHAVDWHFGHDDPNKAWRVIGYIAMPIATTAIHGSAAIENYGFRPPPATDPPAAVKLGLVRP